MVVRCDELQGEVRMLRAESSGLRRENADLRAYVQLLLATMKTAGVRAPPPGPSPSAAAAAAASAAAAAAADGAGPTA
jgi:hypothetical protein